MCGDKSIYAAVDIKCMNEFFIPGANKPPKRSNQMASNIARQLESFKQGIPSRAHNKQTLVCAARYVLSFERPIIYRYFRNLMDIVSVEHINPELEKKDSSQEMLGKGSGRN